jgi:uncharacterized protein
LDKHKVSWQEFQALVNKICRDINNSGWRPDYIVGITRGGLLPALMMSHYFEVPCQTLKVSLRDDNDCESNLWMAENAFGHELDRPANILIVDDINDTGATLNWIMKDWPSGCFPHDDRWDTVWNYNVRFAVMYDNLASKCDVKMDYVGEEINKAERDIWIDFPYEDWWTK